MPSTTSLLRIIAISAGILIFSAWCHSGSFFAGSGKFGSTGDREMRLSAQADHFDASPFVSAQRKSAARWVFGTTGDREMRRTGQADHFDASPFVSTQRKSAARWEPRFLKNASGDTIRDGRGRPVPFAPFELEWENSTDSRLNLSYLLDKPAGRDGFITIRDGQFVKPSGERFRVWGVNLTAGACFPRKGDAAAYAAFLARFGINTVRFHFLDSNWGPERSLFNYEVDNTREFNPEQLDLLDYFIYELKKAGIYSNINLNVGRTFREGDGVADHDLLGFAKGVTLFDDRMIELQKEFARQLLTHVNPYTGNAYVNEPAVAFVEIVNENSLVEFWYRGMLLGENTDGGGGTWRDITPYYGKMLTRKYNDWLSENVGTTDIAAIRKEAGVGPGDEIPRLAPSEFGKASDLRFHTEARFIIQTERDFYTGMYDYLKNELGVRSPVAANSDHGHWRCGYALLSSLSLLDFVDGHIYWQHPSSRIDPSTGTSHSFIQNTPMVNEPAVSTPVSLARSPVKGMPFTISETNHPFPSEYAAEGIPMLTAYSLLHDWDGIYQHEMATSAPHSWNISRPGAFAIFADPVKMANLAASGLMFLRGDLQPAPTTVYRGYDENAIIEGIRKTSGRPFFTDGFSPVIPLIHKTRISSFETKVEDFPLIGEKDVIVAETGEITWHNRGRNFVEISSPRSEAIVGYLPGPSGQGPGQGKVPDLVQGQGLKHLGVIADNDFASVTLVSLDGESISSAGRLLLVATGRSGLDGMVWNDERTRLVERGERPAIIEIISGRVSIGGLGEAKKIIVEPLDGKGNPFASFEVPVTNGSASFNVGNQPTVWYHLEVKR
jgi:hypothetical protein